MDNELNLSTTELQKQYEALKNDCNGFDNELAKLNQEYVQKMQAVKKLQNELVELRGKYNKKIDAGDVKGADGVLGDIAKERKKLNVLVSDLAKDGQLDELKKRSDTFNKETQQLYNKIRDNWQAVLLLMNLASALTGTILKSFNHNFYEIESTIFAAKKLLSELFRE